MSDAIIGTSWEYQTCSYPSFRFSWDHQWCPSPSFSFRNSHSSSQQRAKAAQHLWEYSSSTCSTSEEWPSIIISKWKIISWLLLFYDKWRIMKGRFEKLIIWLHFLVIYYLQFQRHRSTSRWKIISCPILHSRRKIWRTTAKLLLHSCTRTPSGHRTTWIEGLAILLMPTAFNEILPRRVSKLIPLRRSR